MSLKKTLLKNSSLNILGYIYLLIASFFSIPWLLSSLGPQVFGFYVIYTSIIVLAATVDFGLASAGIRFLSLPEKTQSDKNRFWQTSFWLFILFGLIVSLLVLILSLSLINHLPAASVVSQHDKFLSALVVSVIVLTNHLIQHFLILPQVNQRFDVYNLRTLIIGTGNTLITAWLATRFNSLPVIFSFQLTTYLITLFFLYLYSKNNLGVQHLRPVLDRPSAKKLLNFGVKNFIGRLASQIRAQASTYFLGGMLSAQAVTVFNIPQSLVVKAAGGISQLTLSFFPMSASLTSKDRIDKLKKLVIYLELGIFLLGLLQLYIVDHFGYQFLVWWLKDVQIASFSYPVLKILSWFFLLTSLTPIPTTVLDSLNYPQIPSTFAVLSATLNILLIVILTPKYQVLGPAYATIISSFIVAPSFLITFAIIFNRHLKHLHS